MMKKAPMAVRLIALILGLSILGATWIVLTYVTWGVFTFFGMVGGPVVSAVILLGGVLSYGYVATRLFWGGGTKGERRVAAGRKTGWAAAIAAAAGILIAGSDARGAAVGAPAGPGRAAALARSWARHVGAPDRRLDASGDMALGESGLLYDAANDALIGRVYVNIALIKGMGPEALATQQRMVAALNDPKIGGMYDRGGGSFMLDEAREAYYLVRAFRVARTTPATLVEDMERMRAAAPTWTAKWLFEVAMIMHGNRMPPTQPQTLPY